MKVQRNPGRVKLSLPAFRLHKERGFTLIELLIVVFIAGILLMGAIPMVSSWYDRNKLVGVARAIVNDLHFCRQKAISENKYYTIDFTGTTLPISYDIKYGSSVGSYTLYKTISYPESTDFTSFSFSADPVFNYRGMAMSTATVTITNQNGTTRTVTVTLGGKISLS